MFFSGSIRDLPSLNHVSFGDEYSLVHFGLVLLRSEVYKRE